MNLHEIPNLKECTPNPLYTRGNNYFSYSKLFLGFSRATQQTTKCTDLKLNNEKKKLLRQNPISSTT